MVPRIEFGLPRPVSDVVLPVAESLNPRTLAIPAVPAGSTSDESQQLSNDTVTVGNVIPSLQVFDRFAMPACIGFVGTRITRTERPSGS